MSTRYVTAAAIDVAKKGLEIAASMPIKFKAVKNGEQGIDRLIAELSRVRPDITIIEATGGYQNAVVAALHKSGLKVHVSNPSRIRHFALAAGIVAKTDKVDANVMVKFGLAMQPEPTPESDPETQELNELRARHQQLTEMLVAEKNRRHQAPTSTKAGIEEHIAWLNKRIRDIEKEIANKIQSCEKFNSISRIAQTVPGVGPGTTAALLGALPEIGSISHKQIASLVGVAPYACDSGPSKGKRTIRGGRASVRCALYMAVVSALRWNDHIKEYYKHLLARGKCKKIALVACIRKLLIILNAMIRDNKNWCPDPIGA